MSTRLRDRPCNICAGIDTVYVRERKAGSVGMMAQSFAGAYRLCQTCLVRAQRMNAVQNVETFEHRRTKREPRYTVLAKTFAILHQLVHEGRR